MTRDRAIEAAVFCARGFKDSIAILRSTDGKDYHAMRSASVLPVAESRVVAIVDENGTVTMKGGAK